ncbi:siderophore ferric iron reductase [Vibrio fluvialis]|nr:siderophore ferric iron reductase [Vibrio fluvialis]
MHQVSMQSQAAFESLFHYAQQITPYLDGRIGTAQGNEDVIALTRNNGEVFASLYEELKAATPEAGQAYWLTRTWGLLCWQPVYLSFLSVYTQKALPDFTRLAQYRRPMFVAGFSFEPHEWQTGKRTQLIYQAAQQLNTLFEQYREAMNQFVRIRPGFTQHLLADMLLSCLVRLQQLRPHYSNAQILTQARLWLDAFELQEKHLASLKLDPETQQLKLIRSSCCLVYKCHGRSVCADCPRAAANKQELTIELTLVH